MNITALVLVFILMLKLNKYEHILIIYIEMKILHLVPRCHHQSQFCMSSVLVSVFRKSFLKSLT